MLNSQQAVYQLPQKQLKWFAVSLIMKLEKFIKRCYEVLQFSTSGKQGSLHYNVLVYRPVGNPILQTLHISKFFPIKILFDSGFCLSRDFLHTGFCPFWILSIRNFVQFGILSNLGFCPIRDFAHAGFCPIRAIVHLRVCPIQNLVQNQLILTCC